MSSLAFFSFNDNGIAGASGGVYGPFSFSARGVMFLGATVPNGASSAPLRVQNIPVRVHPGSKPTCPTAVATGTNQPGVSNDGIPLSQGGWFRMQDFESNWWFSVDSNGDGLPFTYQFALIQDECFISVPGIITLAGTAAYIP
jgi:hypothetical protein